MSADKYRFRVRLLIAPFLIAAVAIVGKLYFLQIVHGQDYVAQANRSAVRPQSGVFNRGAIYFTTKTGEHVSAATLKTGYLLAIKPVDIGNPEALYEKLSKVIPIDQSEFLAKARKEGDPYEEITHQVTEDQASAIRKLKLTGVILESEQWRFYPGDTLAAPVLGFVAYDGDKQIGRYGLERYYEDVLSRGEGGLYVNFFTEVFSAAREIFASPAETRGDLITTIEPTVQIALERELKGISDEWSPKRVGGIIMDPETGEIVAMGVYPSFSLNDFTDADPVFFKNPLVENVYEMGSIIKPLTMAAGIDSGAVTANTTYNDKGFLEVDTATIRNFDGKGRGVVSMQEVLSQSLNTGVSFVVEKMGIRLFSDYMERFGLGEETGIDLPGELGGLISNLNSPRRVEHYTASFGQGIALTPVETVRALASVGNGGVLVTPHVVKAIKHETGVTRTLAQPEPVRVISKETSHEVSRMLTVVVDTALVEGKNKLEHYSVAAKTGTAQIANPNGGGYYDDRYLHSFFGYFPSYDPKFIVFFYVLEPVGVKYASQTLADPFSRISKFLINYYEIPPDR